MVSALAYAASAGCGVFIRVWANLLGKERVLARPWNIVACGVIGAVAINYSEKFQVWAVDEINKERLLRGQAAMEIQDFGIFGVSEPTEELFPDPSTRRGSKPTAYSRLLEEQNKK